MPKPSKKTDTAKQPPPKPVYAPVGAFAAGRRVTTPSGEIFTPTRSSGHVLARVRGISGGPKEARLPAAAAAVRATSPHSLLDDRPACATPVDSVGSPAGLRQLSRWLDDPATGMLPGRAAFSRVPSPALDVAAMQHQQFPQPSRPRAATPDSLGGAADLDEIMCHDVPLPVAMAGSLNGGVKGPQPGSATPTRYGGILPSPMPRQLTPVSDPQEEVDVAALRAVGQQRLLTAADSAADLPWLVAAVPHDGCGPSDDGGASQDGNGPAGSAITGQAARTAAFLHAIITAHTHVVAGDSAAPLKTPPDQVVTPKVPPPPPVLAPSPRSPSRASRAASRAAPEPVAPPPAVVAPKPLDPAEIERRAAEEARRSEQEREDQRTAARRAGAIGRRDDTACTADPAVQGLQEVHTEAMHRLLAHNFVIPPTVPAPPAPAYVPPPPPPPPVLPPTGKPPSRDTKSRQGKRQPPPEDRPISAVTATRDGEQSNRGGPAATSEDAVAAELAAVASLGAAEDPSDELPTTPRLRFVTEARHITVGFDGQFFACDVVAPDGAPLSSHAIAVRLQSILDGTVDAVAAAAEPGAFPNRSRPTTAGFSPLSPVSCAATDGLGAFPPAAPSPDIGRLKLATGAVAAASATAQRASHRLATVTTSQSFRVVRRATTAIAKSCRRNHTVVTKLHDALAHVTLTPPHQALPTEPSLAFDAALGPQWALNGVSVVAFPDGFVVRASALLADGATFAHATSWATAEAARDPVMAPSVADAPEAAVVEALDCRPPRPLTSSVASASMSPSRRKPGSSKGKRGQPEEPPPEPPRKPTVNVVIPPRPTAPPPEALRVWLPRGFDVGAAFSEPALALMSSPSPSAQIDPNEVLAAELRRARAPVHAGPLRPLPSAEPRLTVTVQLRHPESLYLAALAVCAGITNDDRATSEAVQAVPAVHAVDVVDAALPHSVLLRSAALDSALRHLRNAGKRCGPLKQELRQACAAGRDSIRCILRGPAFVSQLRAVADASVLQSKGGRVTPAVLAETAQDTGSALAIPQADMLVVRGQGDPRFDWALETSNTAPGTPTVLLYGGSSARSSLRGRLGGLYTLVALRHVEGRALRQLQDRAVYIDGLIS